SSYRTREARTSRRRPFVLPLPPRTCAKNSLHHPKLSFKFADGSLMPIHVTALPSTVIHQGANGAASWSCYRVDDAAKFKRFLFGPVRHRHDDDTATALFEEELLQLATADVD